MNPDPGLIEREWINSSKLSIDEAEVTAEDSRHGCPPLLLQSLGSTGATGIRDVPAREGEYNRICGRAFG